jgi:hypothetical protein
MPCRDRPGAGALVALACAAILTGCGGSSDRDALRAYIEKANTIQRQGTPGVQAANRAYADFSRGKLAGAAAVAALTAAADDLRTVRNRLAGLGAPAAARTLRRRLLGLFDADVGLAGEALALATYVPAARAALAPLPAAGLQLRDALAGATTPPQQQLALRGYGRALGRLEARVRRLQPPPVLVASYRSQLLRLATARGLTVRIRAAIGARDAALVARLLLRFRAVNNSPGASVGVQRAAVQAYRRRVSAVGAAAAAAQREEARLNQVVQ